MSLLGGCRLSSRAPVGSVLALLCRVPKPASISDEPASFAALQPTAQAAIQPTRPDSHDRLNALTGGLASRTCIEFGTGQHSAKRLTPILCPRVSESGFFCGNYFDVSKRDRMYPVLRSLARRAGA